MTILLGSLVLGAAAESARHLRPADVIHGSSGSVEMLADSPGYFAFSGFPENAKAITAGARSWPRDHGRKDVPVSVKSMSDLPRFQATANKTESTEDQSVSKSKKSKKSKKSESEKSKDSNYVPVAHHEQRLEEKRIHGHHLFASVILCFLLTITVAFALVSSSNKVVVSSTWSVLDTVIVVIIASSLFYITSSLFEDITADYPKWHVPLHIAYASVLFVAATFGSYAIRNQEKDKAIFDAVMFWVVLLAKGGALSEVHQAEGKSLQDNVVILFGSLGFFVVLIYLTHRAKPESGWYDATETSLAGGAFAGGFVTIVDMVINGHDMEGSEEALVSNENAMLHGGFAIVTCIAAVCLTTPLANLKKKNADRYWFCRVLDFLSAFIGVLPYFTVSMGIGKHVSSMLGVGPTTKMAMLVSAMVGGIMGVAMILACAFVPALQGQTDDQKALTGLILGFGGFIVGAGWAGLICGSVKELAEGRGLDEHKKVQFTIGILCCINVILVPVYVVYIKPVIMAKTA